MTENFNFKCSEHSKYQKDCNECCKMMTLKWYHTHKNEKLYCDLCQKDYPKYRKKEHVLSKKHRKFEQIEQKIYSEIF